MSQRAIAAREAWPLYEVGHVVGKSSPRTRDVLAGLFGVSDKSIQQARALPDDLAAKVKAGERSLADAREGDDRVALLRALPSGGAA